MSKRSFSPAAALFVGAWLLMWPWGGYSQTATATCFALPLHLVATVLVNIDASRKPSPIRRRLLVAVGSLSLLALGGLFAVSNLFFWNAGP